VNTKAVARFARRAKRASTTKADREKLEMKTRREIVEILCDEFVELSCENCEYKNTKYCADCDLENCYWELSRKAAARIADQILED